MDPESVTKAVIAVLVPLATGLGLGSRRRRLRNEIRENLALVKDVEQDDILREHTAAAAWLQGKIAVDIARLAGQKLGTPKKPVPWGSVVAAALMALGFGLWTWYIVRDGYVWYSVFPGTLAVLLAIAVIGLFMNRELPPEQTDGLPPGATPIRTDSTSEQIATAVHLAAVGGTDDRFAPSGQVGVVLRFITAMRQGDYEVGLELADRNWLLCRIQSWLWNNRDAFGDVEAQLESLATTLLDARTPEDTWTEFVASEVRGFVEAWSNLDAASYGAASRRRRLGRDYDLVVLAPLGKSGGYFVHTATAIMDALTFVLHREGGQWLVANHLGCASPEAGWPPTWWSTVDPAIDALPDS